MRKNNNKKKINRTLDLDLVEQATKVKGMSEKKHNNTKSTKSIIMPIDKTLDRYLILFKKKLINILRPSVSDVYSVKGQKDGYNLIYSLKKNRQLGSDRFEEWDQILGIRLKEMIYYKYDWNTGEYLSDEPIIIDIDDDEGLMLDTLDDEDE